MKLRTKIMMLTAVFALLGSLGRAKLNVVTTLPDLKALVAEIGGPDAVVDSIAKGTQDPHFIEAKPSYMVKVNRADLVVSIGLDLEIGWLPPVLQGARNPKVMPATKGYLEVGPLVETLEKPKGGVSRAAGDVHPQGNPHVNLDPIRMGGIALKIAERMGELDPDHAAEYAKRAEALKARLEKKTKDWQERVSKTGVKSVITYHSTLLYFLDRFGVKTAAYLEPKPGIPPTASHIMEVIQIVKDEKVPLILVENYFDPEVTRRILEEAPWVKTRTVPVLVNGSPEIKSLDDLYEALVTALEAK